MWFTWLACGFPHSHWRRWSRGWWRFTRVGCRVPIITGGAGAFRGPNSIAWSAKECLGAPRSAWERSGAPGSAWERLGAPGNVWERLAGYSSVWERMEAFSSAWERLGAPGSVSERFQVF